MRAPASTMYFTERSAAISISNSDRGAALRMRFIGANPRAQLVAHGRAAAGWTTSRPGAPHGTCPPTRGPLTATCGRESTCRSELKGTKLKYPFLVRPGADPLRHPARPTWAAVRPDHAVGRVYASPAPSGRAHGLAPYSYQRAPEVGQCRFDSSFVLATGRWYGFAVWGNEPTGRSWSTPAWPTRPASEGRSSEETFRPGQVVLEGTPTSWGYTLIGLAHDYRSLPDDARVPEFFRPRAEQGWVRARVLDLSRRERLKKTEPDSGRRGRLPRDRLHALARLADDGRHLTPRTTGL